MLDYLVELAELRGRSIVDVAEYDSVLWLSDVPSIDGVVSRIDPHQSADVWLEVRRPPEPRPPAPPETVRGWIDGDRGDGPFDPPPLRSAHAQLAAGSELAIATVPVEVETNYRRWVDTAWRDYEQRRIESVRADEIYRRLSAIHQAEQRLGEEYELVLGVGLLSWRAPDQGPIRRHLITANANLAFDPEQGTFTLGPAFDGSPLRAELDMLDVRHRPREALRSAERLLLSAHGDPFRRRPVDRVLATLTRAMPGRARFHPDQMTPDEAAGEQPSISFSPALILRRRSHRGVRLALRKIRDRIERDESIPPLLLDLVELAPPDRVPAEETSEAPLFPLPVNREQRRVREVALRSRGTLVQGPPGTGKTHTIANLLCDLLARGQRVLVTAQTPRALGALRRLLPDEIRPLCVHWLGSGVSERRSMEDGVRRILDRHALFDPALHQAEIGRLRRQLEQLRVEEGEILARIARSREASREVQSIGDGGYRGTAAELARRLATERRSLGFVDDEVDVDAPPPPSHVVEELLDTFDRVALRDADPGGRIDPDVLRALPSPDDFDATVRLLIEAKNAEALRTTAPFVGTLEGVATPRIQALGASFRDLHAAVSAAWRRAPSWAATAMRDIFRDRAARWRELAAEATKRIDGLLERARRADAQQLELPEDVDLVAITRDGEELHRHLLSGGRLKRGLFRAPIVSRTTYLWRDIRLDGRRLDNPGALADLLEHLAVRRDVQQLWRCFRPHLIPSGGPLAGQVTELAESLEVLTQVLSLADLQAPARDALADVAGLPEPRWHDPGSLADYADSARAALADPGIREASTRLSEAERTVDAGAPGTLRPPALDALLDAIRRRDRQAYRLAHADLADVARSSAVSRRREVLVERLSQVAPRMAHQIVADGNKDRWRRRLARLPAAWEHARARTWMSRWQARTDEHPLRRHLAQVEERRRRASAELAAALAWKHCFARMTDEHRRHLVAWGQAMRAIGAGTGRGAARARREAQGHLTACRDAVPAWVMPLYRVYDTLEPEEGMFDVAVIDDASQCGQDALPLFYLARRVIVVGDDQQIRPTPIGIDPARVDLLQQTHLADLRHRDSFRPECSLFDHAVLRFGDRIVLREHFRCQPEIIRFSDELCYDATPLIPVRRIGASRLTPLRAVFIERAEREGKGPGAINRAEADALVATVVEAARSERYRGRSFGVICLTGGAQARRIETSLLTQLGEQEFAARRLVCGNPYSFQGDERDVVFLSLVAAPNDIGPALTRSDFVRRFNVAASRARDQMWLFHSVTADQLSEHDLRRRLIEFFHEPPPEPASSSPAICALRPNRDTKPRSKFTRPLIPSPSASFGSACARISSEGISASNPDPKNGIGLRTTDVIPGSSGARPGAATEYCACTSSSALSSTRTNTSRYRLADPPKVGFSWHPPQKLALNSGPSPSPTANRRTATSRPRSNAARTSASMPGSGSPISANSGPLSRSASAEALEHAAVTRTATAPATMPSLVTTFRSSGTPRLRGRSSPLAGTSRGSDRSDSDNRPRQHRARPARACPIRRRGSSAHPDPRSRLRWGPRRPRRRRRFRTGR